MNVLVLQGPNLHLLGEREPHIYGHLTLPQLHQQLRQHARTRGLSLKIFQTNHEGQLIDWLEKYQAWMQALIINPGALTHYSWALKEAVQTLTVPVHEVHLSKVFQREAFRKVSVLKGVRKAVHQGKGVTSYLEALEALRRPMKSSKLPPVAPTRAGRGKKPTQSR